MKTLVVTSRSLHVLLDRSREMEWTSDFQAPPDASWKVLSDQIPDATYCVAREDSPKDVPIVIAGEAREVLARSAPDNRLVMLQRAHRAAVASSRLPLSLPTAWSEYHHNGLVAFFATRYGDGDWRWIMEIVSKPLAAVCFWRLTSGGDTVLLQDFSPSRTDLEAALRGWPAAAGRLVERWKTVPTRARTEDLQESVDLEDVTFGAVTQYRSYSEWLQKLTKKQRTFLHAETKTSLKLRGPAGSGKTLTLELKALRELYSARTQGKSLRILFATHSWAVAEQVDEALRTLDESGNVGEIDILPLVALSVERLPQERTGPGFRLLGEDSLSGKSWQLERIATHVETIAQGDWLTFRRQTSPDLRTRVESAAGTPERNSLVWDLMNEFSSVLSANGILPGVNASRRYLAIQRTPWMMPLPSDADKAFVLRVYSDYVQGLRTEGVLTSDQLINDYLNYLETFQWNLRRAAEGYDLIFVDELHLFSEQERLVLNLLSRSADEYPRLFMALDPRQAPTEVYFGPVAGQVHSGESGEAEMGLGAVEAIDLGRVHRFSPEVLALVRHINNSFPALDLGTDWQWDFDSVNSSASNGRLPRLHRHTALSDEIQAVAAMAGDVVESPAGRTAIVVLNPLLLPDFATAAEGRCHAVVTISSRADVAELRYRKRSVVVSAAEYLGGLQFARVVVAGFQDTRGGFANRGYQMRRFLALLYLAISRCTQIVEIHVNDECGGVPEVLASAIQAGLLEADE